MKQIFEEYGKLILVVFVLVAVIGIIFGSSLFSDLGEQVDVDTTLINGEEKVSEVFDRALPTIEAKDAGSLKYLKNDEFYPLNAVIAKDADGQVISNASIKVVNIKSVNALSGEETEIVYDNNTGKVDVGDFTGTIIVTYRVIDSYNISNTKTISFVVDNKNGN